MKFQTETLPIATLRQRIVSLEPHVCGAPDISARVNANGSIIDVRISNLSLLQSTAETRGELGPVGAATNGSSTNAAHTVNLGIAARVAQGLIGTRLSVKGNKVRWFYLQILF